MQLLSAMKVTTQLITIGTLLFCHLALAKNPILTEDSSLANLLYVLNKNLSPEQVRQIVIETSDMGSSWWDESTTFVPNGVKAMRVAALSNIMPIEEALQINIRERHRENAIEQAGSMVNRVVGEYVWFYTQPILELATQQDLGPHLLERLKYDFPSWFKGQVSEFANELRNDPAWVEGRALRELLLSLYPEATKADLQLIALGTANYVLDGTKPNSRASTVKLNRIRMILAASLSNVLGVRDAIVRARML